MLLPDLQSPGAGGGKQAEDAAMRPHSFIERFAIGFAIGFLIGYAALGFVFFAFGVKP